MRRHLYNKQYGFFPFCAPAGFRHQDQPVDIVDIYHKYNNPDKRYIYSVYEGESGGGYVQLGSLRLDGGQSYLIGYKENNIQYTVEIQHAQTLRTTPFFGIGTELDVDSTIGFTESGVISYLDYYYGYRFFKYTSKTSTKFIGEPQLIRVHESLLRNFYVLQSLDFTNRSNGYVIVNNSALNIDANLTSINEAKWLYAGRNCNGFLAGYNVGIGGICRVKYIHYEDKNISFLPHNAIDYSQFWNGYLDGVMTIPNKVKYINSLTVVSSNNITEINFPSVLERIGNGAITIADNAAFNLYPLIAPIITNGTNPLGGGRKGVLHISHLSTGYDVAPWTDTNIFTQIIRDL